MRGDDVAGLWVTLRQVAEEHLIELRVALDQMLAEPKKLLTVDRSSLLKRAKRGDVLVIDVRP